MAHRKDVLQVSSELAQLALGAALRQWLAGQSWSQVRQLVKTRRILIDGNVVTDPGQRLKQGQVVKLLTDPLAPPATDRDVQLVHVDADIVVVDKPTGLTSIRHPEERFWSERRKQLQPTLTELLPRLLAKKERATNPRTQQRAVRAVHRLDRETSGLMVFARNVKAEQLLGQQFRAHTIHRSYQAIVRGAIAAQTIETFLVRDRGDGRRGSSDGEHDGKLAITHVQPIEALPGYTLIACRLETGRTHQIRIHLAERGHPVCGDKVYGKSGRPNKPGTAPPRLALHAAELGFIHPRTHQVVRFQSPLPEALEQFLSRIRRGGSRGSAGLT